jgi:plastocyanin
VLALAATPVLAQDDAEMMSEPLEVVGVEYAFVGLPTSVPAGTEIAFQNDGAELHEIVIARINDDTTESIAELLEMGDAAMEKITIVGEGPLIAEPGAAAEGTLALEQEGNYVALCFIPQGFVPEALAAAGLGPNDLGPDTDPSTLPEEVQAIMMNPPHLAAGMIQEFTVTAAGTEPGPLPEEPAA